MVNFIKTRYTVYNTFYYEVTGLQLFISKLPVRDLNILRALLNRFKICSSYMSKLRGRILVLYFVTFKTFRSCESSIQQFLKQTSYNTNYSCSFIE